MSRRASSEIDSFEIDYDELRQDQELKEVKLLVDEIFRLDLVSASRKRMPDWEDGWGQNLRDFEKDFMTKVTNAGKQAEYGNVLSEFEANYKAIAPYALSRDYFIEVVMRNTELLSFGYRLYQLETIYTTRGEKAFNDRKANLIEGFDELYKDFNANVDEKVMEQLLEIYATKSPKEFLPQEFVNQDLKAKTAEIFKTSKLTNYNGLKELLNGDAKTVLESMNKDSGFVFVKMLAEAYTKNVVPKYEELNLKNTALQRTYMKGILELSPKALHFYLQ